MYQAPRKISFTFAKYGPVLLRLPYKHVGTMSNDICIALEEQIKSGYYINFSSYSLMGLGVDIEVSFESAEDMVLAAILFGEQ